MTDTLITRPQKPEAARCPSLGDNNPAIISLSTTAARRTKENNNTRLINDPAAAMRNPPRLTLAAGGEAVRRTTTDANISLHLKEKMLKDVLWRVPNDPVSLTPSARDRCQMKLC